MRDFFLSFAVFTSLFLSINQNIIQENGLYGCLKFIVIDLSLEIEKNNDIFINVLPSIRLYVEIVFINVRIFLF